MTYNESIENMVEVNLTADCYGHVPAVDPNDGTLCFKKVSMVPYGVNLKVKVPSEVVESQEALSQYLFDKQENYVEIYLDDINILDGDEFRF